MEPRSFSPVDHFEGRQNEKNERMKRVTALKTTEALTWENILRWKEVEFLQQPQVRLCADVRCLASADTPHQPCELFTPWPRCSRGGGRSVSSVSDWADLYWVHVTHVKNSPHRHFTAVRYTRPHPQTGSSDLRLTPGRKNKTREKRHRNTPASAPVSFLPWPGSSRRYAGQKLLTNTATDVGTTLQVPTSLQPFDWLLLTHEAAALIQSTWKPKTARCVWGTVPRPDGISGYSVWGQIADDWDRHTHHVVSAPPRISSAALRHAVRTE